jgi:hypothetical protein
VLNKANILEATAKINTQIHSERGRKQYFQYLGMPKKMFRLI